MQMIRYLNETKFYAPDDIEKVSPITIASCIDKQNFDPFLLAVSLGQIDAAQYLSSFVKKDDINFYLDKGTIQYIHINPRGKFSPLQVKIFRNYGKIKTFVSKKIAEPCEEIHDEEFNRDMFEINDLSGVFRIDRIALGIKALTDSNFVISIKYKSTETKSKFGETDRKQLFFYSKKNLVEEDTLDEKIKEAKIKSE